MKELIESIKKMSKEDYGFLLIGVLIILGALMYGIGLDLRTSLVVTCVMIFYLYMGRRELWKKKN